TLLRYPEIKPMIRRIVCMVGSGYMGNMNSYAEFNAWVDPDACHVVFNSGVPIVMCGLDGNEPCGLNVDELQEYIGRKSSQSDLLDHIFKFFIQRRGEPGQKDNNQVINDAVTMAYLIDDKIGTTKKQYVAVETKGDLCVGQTIVDRLNKYKKEPNAEVLLTSNKALFKKMLDDMVDFYS
ncbi:MAG: nucleoside hydrolase, partial [Oscillospiraceae bacterium]